MENASPARRSPSTAPRLVARGRQLPRGETLLRFKMRLRFVAGLSFIGELAFLVHLLVAPRPIYKPMLGLDIGITGFLVLLSAAALFASRSDRVPDHKVPRIAVTLMVLSGLGLAVVLNQLPWPREIGLPGWTPVTVIVVVTSIVMVFRPKVTLVAGLVATLGEVLIIHLLEAEGVITLPPPEELAMRLGPNFTGPVIAALANLLVWRMSAHLGEAEALGAYRLSERLGQGGMGEVWRATHQMLKRPAAVKLIQRDGLGEASRADRVVKRFQREAQATAALCSPHTIEIYDFGVTDEGAFFYVMELLDGVDLGTLVERHGPLPAERVVHLLGQACHSLSEAHVRGLVHRDIKPANLFACRYGTDVDFLKVLDFGLVKQQEASGETSQLTIEGVISGTPAYMAPEQVLGEDLDGRADLYALGCVAWFLLTGRDPFEGRVATQVMFAHLNSAPEPPSSASEMPIPPELDALVLALMAKAPADRPATASEVGVALAAVPLPRPWTSERAHAWWDARLPGDSPMPSEARRTPTAKRTTR